MRGICKMCLQDKELVESHFIPAAIYDYCRAGKQSPIRIAGGAAFPTDRQTQVYLLCGECENILNTNGERWLNAKLATMDRKFPLYDLITRQAPVYTIDATDIYFSSNNPEVLTDCLVHFAMGIFWKAAVHSWLAGKTEPRIELAPYTDVIRMWLRGEGTLPSSIALSISVSRPDRAQITFNEPHEARSNEDRTFVFHVPGVFFMLHVGESLPDVTKQFCLHHSSFHPIFVSEEMTQKVEDLFREMFHKSRKTDALMRTRVSREKELRNGGKS